MFVCFIGQSMDTKYGTSKRIKSLQDDRFQFYENNGSVYKNRSTHATSWSWRDIRSESRADSFEANFRSSIYFLWIKN